MTKTETAPESDAWGPLPPAGADWLLCIGHSHVNCVAEAALEQGFLTIQGLNFWALPGAIETRDDGTMTLGAGIIRRLQRHAGKVFSLIGGSAPSVVGMLVHPRRFDFVLPEQPDLPLDADAECVPAAVIEQVLRKQMAPYFGLMEQVRGYSPGGMLHIEPPPPSTDAARLLEDVPWSLYPPDMKREISPLSLRCKLWRLHSRIVREWCRSHDVVFVPCPEACLDENGCLADACYGDGAHANIVYGRHVLEQMRQLA